MIDPMHFTGGNIAERIMRDRGRIRGMIAAWNLKQLKQRLQRFVIGNWTPASGRDGSNYAISLTSWSKRLGELQLTLLTLLDQNVRPSAIQVWLTDGDLELLPEERRALFEAHGVRFKTCPDFRAHKKWLPMILSGHKEPFVVCDDDIFYPREWFGNLVAEDREEAYVGCKCHMMRFGEGGRPAPYSSWVKQISRQSEASHLIFSTGCGGEILHPTRLGKNALDWEAIREIAYFNDDIWLKFAHLAAGIPAYKTAYSFPVLELPGTNETGLLANHNTSNNDKQIMAAWEYFGITADHFKNH